jgi:hypothetical protein
VLGWKVFGAGLPGLAVQALCQDVMTSLTATGTNQATAYPITTAKALFSTVTSGTGAVLSLAATAGDSQVVFNAGANPLKVYPPTGAKINSLPTNTGVLLATNTGCEFHCMSATQWFGVLSA